MTDCPLLWLCSDLLVESQYDVQTCGIYADFSLGAKVYQDVEDTLKEFEVGILGERRVVRKEGRRGEVRGGRG